jgi:WD40 repeat protein
MQAGTAAARIEGYGVSFSPDGLHVLTLSGRAARVWDLTGAQILTIDHEDTVRSARYSADGHTILTSSGSLAQLWNAETGALIITLEHENNIYDAIYSPDGKQILTRGGVAQVWDAHTGAPLLVLGGHPIGAETHSFTPDGKLIVTTSGLLAFVWDARTGARISSLEPGGRIDSVVISPDGEKMIVTTTFGTEPKILNLRNGSTVGVLKGHDGIVERVRFSPDGQLIVTGAYDSTARVWSSANYSTLMVLRGHERRIEAAEFSLDGQWIITGSYDGTARIWKRPILSSSEVMEYTSVVALRSLSSEEKDEYFLSNSKTPTDYRGDESECDHLAANPYDPKRRGKGVAFRSVGKNAVRACQAEVDKHPNEPRFLYQLGRALDAAGERKEALRFYSEAAQLGYAAAHHNLGNIYVQRGPITISKPLFVNLAPVGLMDLRILAMRFGAFIGTVLMRSLKIEK